MIAAIDKGRIRHKLDGVESVLVRPNECKANCRDESGRDGAELGRAGYSAQSRLRTQLNKVGRSLLWFESSQVCKCGWFAIHATMTTAACHVINSEVASNDRLSRSWDK